MKANNTRTGRVVIARPALRRRPPTWTPEMDTLIAEIRLLSKELDWLKTEVKP